MVDKGVEPCIDPAYAAAKRKRSAARVRRGARPVRRQEHPLTNVSFSLRWLLLQMVDGHLQVTLRGARNRQEHYSIKMRNLAHFVFADRETVEAASPLFPSHLQFVIENELEQGIPGISIILTRDLCRIWWAPIEEEPTIRQWQEWLNKDINGLVSDIIQIQSFSYFRDDRKRTARNNRSVYHKGVKNEIDVNGNWDSHELFYSWLPWMETLLWLNLPTDPYQRKTGVEERTVTMVDENQKLTGRIPPDGKASFYNFEGERPKLNSLGRPRRFTLANVPKRQAPLDLLATG